jgi:multiple sugar transport system permease protein
MTANQVRATPPSVAARPPQHASGDRLSARATEAIAGYLFLLPDLLGLALFVVLPIGAAAFLSLHDWNGFTDPKFIGLANYELLLADPAFLDSVRITVTYVLLFVPALIVVSLGLAMLVNQHLRFTWFFRSAFFLPVMFSLVVASVVWTQIFQENGGILNWALGLVGIPPQPWLGSTDQALLAVAIVALWQGIGYNMIIFLAGLQDIPTEYYDAAAVDGANAVSRFRHITLPQLRRTTVFVLVTSLIAAFQVFDPIFVMTSGGPANATRTTVFYVYENAFSFLRLGYASAISVVLFLMIFAFTGMQLRLFRTTED